MTGIRSDIDIDAIERLFEEMLTEIKNGYLQGYTDCRNGEIHPAGLNRWARDEKYYRNAFQSAMTPKPAPEEQAPPKEIVP